MYAHMYAGMYAGVDECTHQSMYAGIYQRSNVLMHACTPPCMHEVICVCVCMDEAVRPLDWKAAG